MVIVHHLMEMNLYVLELLDALYQAVTLVHHRVMNQAVLELDAIGMVQAVMVIIQYVVEVITQAVLVLITRVMAVIIQDHVLVFLEPHVLVQ